MCCCSAGIIAMKPFVFVSLSPPFPLFLAALIHFRAPHANIVSVFCGLLCPSRDPITPSCLTLAFLPPFSLPSLQRCQCHRCFVSLLSESCRFRSGTSTPRGLSWSPSTRLSTHAGPVTPTSSASSTGQCWSGRRRGTPAPTPAHQLMSR